MELDGHPINYEHLPAELNLMILTKMGSVYDLLQLISASPLLFRIFRANADYILAHFHVGVMCDSDFRVVYRSVYIKAIRERRPGIPRLSILKAVRQRYITYESPALFAEALQRCSEINSCAADYANRAGGEFLFKGRTILRQAAALLGCDAVVPERPTWWNLSLQERSRVQRGFALAELYTQVRTCRLAINALDQRLDFNEQLYLEAARFYLFSRYRTTMEQTVAEIIASHGRDHLRRAGVTSDRPTMRDGSRLLNFLLEMRPSARELIPGMHFDRTRSLAYATSIILAAEGSAYHAQHGGTDTSPGRFPGPQAPLLNSVVTRPNFSQLREALRRLAGGGPRQLREIRRLPYRERAERLMAVLRVTRRHRRRRQPPVAANLHKAVLFGHDWDPVTAFARGGSGVCIWDEERFHGWGRHELVIGVGDMHEAWIRWIQGDRWDTLAAVTAGANAAAAAAARED